MLFCSMEFLFIFFPIIILGNFLLPKKIRNYWLLIGSMFFYAWGEPKFVIVMILSIAFNYFMALGIERTQRTDRKRLFLTVSILVNLGILFVYKYLNFVLENLRICFPKMQIIQTQIVLPIGISFFTFQALSYVIDVYRGIPAQKNLAYLALYISFFPQLIAGPIVRYTTIADQIENRTCSLSKLSKGTMRFVLGLNKKMILANILGEVADKAFSMITISVGMAWIGAICYTLQIFFDFSGYSDMAIGLGKIFGFDFLENFDYPYISKTITEFWRRWHISLGTWFRDYLYIPLGGSRVSSKRRLLLNLCIVWLATGIWHGASWNFILWGILHGAVISIEKICNIPYKANRAWWGKGYQIIVLLVVIFGWVLFRAENMSKAYAYITAMLGIGKGGLIDNNFVFFLREYFVIIILSIICACPVFQSISNRLRVKNTWLGDVYDAAFQLAQTGLFFVSVSFLVISAHNPFIYFNF